jgi:hypothetical protein
LNYRDVYGLRYSPSKKIQERENDELLENGSNFSMTSASFEISPLSQESIIETTTTAAAAVVLQSSENTALSELQENNEVVTDDTQSHHIMKPNNRVEHALNFLTNRMKNLMHYTRDNEIHHDKKLSPHLLTLGKILNLFSLLNVEHTPCLSGRKPLRQLSGTCLNPNECVNLGGISMDRCANGLGVCCICELNH